LKERFLHNRASRNAGDFHPETDSIRTLADGKENACQDADVHDGLRNPDA
jgi:hypothetical protein